MWKAFVMAWRAVKEQERKIKERDRLVGSPLNYPILQDIVNQCTRANVTVRVGPLKTGEFITIEPQKDVQERNLRQRLAGEGSSIEEIIAAIGEGKPINGSF